MDYLKLEHHHPVSQSNHIYIAPYVASESEVHVGGVFTFTVSSVKQFVFKIRLKVQS